ncbi:aldehyde ferredoxin oxidoreductase family protein [Chloroflexota bacterium]
MAKRTEGTKSRTTLSQEMNSSMPGHPGGYTGRMLRVDLSSRQFTTETPDELTLRRYIGGSGIGAYYLYKEVPPGIEWSDPENRLIIASGPLGGTRIPGSGTFSAVTKGAMTNGATTTQANGFLGAYLKLSGFDGIILQGAAASPVYLYIHDGIAELKDASYLAGKDTTETEELIKQELGYKDNLMSVFSIGPAGEHLVRYAGIVGDRGHTAAHNGAGAVMGSKKLKAIAISRGKDRIPIKDEQKFSSLAKMLRERIQKDPRFDFEGIHQYGTLNLYPMTVKMGGTLIKNYTTNICDDDQLAHFSGEYIRGSYSPQLHPCWGCPQHHCHTLRFPDGRHAGKTVEEPEFEGLASWSMQIGQTDLNEAIFLSELVDSLGMDTNESGWVIGLVMECYEKGILTKADTDGLEMNWGNVEAAEKMLHKMARREGFGDLLAEGAMRAAQRIGGEAPDFAIHTMKGNTPRSHDHRLNWRQLFDTCVSSTSTIETGLRIPTPNMEDFGLTPIKDPFSPTEVSTHVAKAKPGLLFEDSLGTCTLCTGNGTRTLSEVVSAITGWDFTADEVLKTGLRIANLLRAFNLRHGITAAQDAPSPRYGSTIADGVFAGKGVTPFWNDMLRNFYELMGWDTATGKPLPQTLKDLDLEYVIDDIL